MSDTKIVKAKNVYSALRGIREVQGIKSSIEGVGSKTAATDSVLTVKQLPGFSPMQLRAQIDRIVTGRQRLTELRTQFESVLSEMDKLESDEKEGIEKLKEAARSVKEKEKYLIVAEKGMLSFTAFMKDQVPGVEQMLADPETVKPGLKAGDFFKRVSDKLGQDVGRAVQTIYAETKEDLTHLADCVSSLKVISKTASVSQTTLKKAGIGDMLVSVKNWLRGGNPDGLVSRLLGFSGNIVSFVKGFAERTGLIKRATDDLNNAFDEARSAIEQALKNY